MSELSTASAKVEDSLLFKGGAKPTLPDHRDYDLIRSHKAAGIFKAPTFPLNYSVDPGLWMPSQNQYEPIFNNPPLPYGCTDYSSADLVNDIHGVLDTNPKTLEDITHANANGGYDIRESIKVLRRLGLISNFFRVKNVDLDWFDAIRYAIIAGTPERRAVSIGVPWYQEWITPYKPILITPSSYNADGIGWHNALVVGWATIEGVPYLKVKSWQGEAVGDRGWLYMSREITNSVMSIWGTCAFSVTSMGIDPSHIKPVDLPILQMVLSIIRTFLPFRYSA